MHAHLRGQALTTYYLLLTTYYLILLPRCGLCTLTCEDKHTDCPAWAAAKEGKGCEADSVSSK